MKAFCIHHVLKELFSYTKMRSKFVLPHLVILFANPGANHSTVAIISPL